MISYMMMDSNIVCRVGQAWTEEDDATLLEAYANGLDIIDIAPIVGRFSKSVTLRLVALGCIEKHEDARGWIQYEESNFAKDPQVEALLAVQRQATADRKEREREQRKQEVAAKKAKIIEDRNRQQTEARNARKREQAERREAKLKLQQERKRVAKEAAVGAQKTAAQPAKNKRKYEKKKPLVITPSAEVSIPAVDPRDARIKQLEEMLEQLHSAVGALATEKTN